MDTVLSEFESCWARHTETKGLLQSELIKVHFAAAPFLLYWGRLLEGKTPYPFWPKYVTQLGPESVVGNDQYSKTRLQILLVEVLKLDPVIFPSAYVQ
jgi:hypothetical protein